MLYKNYFKVFILSVLMLALSQITFASLAESKCGIDIFHVKFYKGMDASEMRQELYYQSPKQKEKLFYKTRPGTYLTVACVENKQKRSFIIFNEYYGGNVGPEDIYGVFDVKEKKILIKPSDWPKGNTKQVSEIIGYPLPNLFEKNRAFCCSRREYDGGD